MNERQSYEEASNAFYPESAESEPLEVPTEEVEADELPLEESDAEVEDLDSEESESEDEEADEVEDDGVIEIDGEDHNLSDIQEWKQAHDNVKSMQADCTKKWQEASELKKDAESEMSKAQDLALTLEVLIAEDEEVDLDELKEYDEVEYYKRKEKINARKAKLKELKANQPSSAPVLTQDELSAELSSLYAMMLHG